MNTHKARSLMYGALTYADHGIHPNDVVSIARWLYGVNPIPDEDEMLAIERRIENVKAGIERVEAARR